MKKLLLSLIWVGLPNDSSIKRRPTPCGERTEMDNTLFFIGLFIIVSGVVKARLVSKLSEGMISLTNGN